MAKTKRVPLKEVPKADVKKAMKANNITNMVGKEMARLVAKELGYNIRTKKGIKAFQMRLYNYIRQDDN